MYLEKKVAIVVCIENYFVLRFFSYFSFNVFRPSMSRGAGLGLDRNHERDFVLSSVEEYVKRFDGTRAINKVGKSLM